jgi:hypothetical protein
MSRITAQGRHGVEAVVNLLWARFFIAALNANSEQVIVRANGSA